MSRSASVPGSGRGGPQKLGRFDLVAPAGRGAMGIVYRVRDPETGEHFALKKLDLAGRAIDRQKLMVKRFEREGRALMKVGEHPHVARVREAGLLPDGSPYLLFEWLDGGSLQMRLAAGGRLPWREAVEIARSLAAALWYIHALGIVHRDLKPGNVLFDERGAVRLTDFGLVRAIEPDDAATVLTNTGAAVGTPRYMAPEQVQGDREAVGPATDIWALGTVLYEMVTGELPFAGKTPAEHYAAILHGRPTAPSSRSGDVPPDLDVVCLRALARDPADRYDANAIMEDLTRVLSGIPVVRTPTRIERAARRRAAVGAGGALALLAVAGAALVLAWPRGEEAVAPDPSLTPAATGPAEPATPEAALLAGDYTRLGDGELHGASRRLVAALALLEAAGESETPDPAAALAELERARQPPVAVALLRAELLGLLGEDDAARAELAREEVAASPLAAVASARLLRDRGRRDESARLLERARRDATARGLGESADRVYEATAGARRFLALAARRFAIAAARAGDEKLSRRADQALVALAARAPESGAGELARASGALERGETEAAVEAASAALVRALAPEERRLALLVRARAHLARSEPEAAARDAAEAAGLGRDAVGARLLEVEARLGAGAEGTFEAADALVAQAQDLPPDHARGRIERLWRARVLLARAEAARGQLAEAADRAAALDADVRATLAEWDALERVTDLDGTLAKDADDFTIRTIRGMVRARADSGSPIWRAGLRDLVRVSHDVPQAVALARGVREVPDHYSLNYLRAGKTAPIERVDALPGAGEPLALALEAFARKKRPSAEELATARAEAERALALEPAWSGAWLLRGLVLDALGQKGEAARSLAIAERLAPDAGELAAHRDWVSGGVIGTAVIDRLILLGADPFYVNALDAASPSPHIDEAARARLEALTRFTGPLAEQMMMLEATHVTERAARERAELAALPPGDDPVVAHLIGVARSREADVARARGDVAAIRSAFERAAAAFERAAEHATPEHRTLHLASWARALLLAGHADAEVIERLGECIEDVERRIPTSRRPIVFNELGGFFIPSLTRLHLLASNRPALLAHRALARLGTGDLEGARADAEAAATDDPAQVAVLARVYRALAER